MFLLILSSDIDECDIGTAECSTYATCTNTDGDYNCTCEAGYSGDGFICSEYNVIPIYVKEDLVL